MQFFYNDDTIIGKKIKLTKTNMKLKCELQLQYGNEIQRQKYCEKKGLK